MAKNKRLNPGKLYQLKDFCFVFESLDVNVSPQVSPVTGEHRINKNDIIMVIEVIEGKSNDYPFYRILTPVFGIQYGTNMLYHRVQEIIDQ
jgi:hypothetical protein